MSETLQGVLGSGENGVQKYREQGAWGQKTREQGAKKRKRGARGPPLAESHESGPALQIWAKNNGPF